jgi:hypothetical protein
MSTHPLWHCYSTDAILDTDAASIWKLIADFNSLPEYLEAVRRSELSGEGVGSKRKLTFQDGKVADETLVFFHPDVHRAGYSMSDPSPFPWKHYFAIQQLQPLGAGATHFLYTGYWQDNGGSPNEITQVLRGVYHGIFAGMARKLGIQAHIRS